jgi:hypothetical protein
VYRGHEGIGEMLRDLYEVLDLIHFEYAEVRDLGDRVVAIGHFRTNGKGIRIRGYLNLDEALDAAEA